MARVIELKKKVPEELWNLHFGDCKLERTFSHSEVRSALSRLLDRMIHWGPFWMKLCCYWVILQNWLPLCEFWLFHKIVQVPFSLMRDILQDSVPFFFMLMERLWVGKQPIFQYFLCWIHITFWSSVISINGCVSTIQLSWWVIGIYILYRFIS